MYHRGVSPVGDLLCQTKRRLRREIEAKLSALTDEEYHESNALIQRRFLNLDRVRRAKTIMIYASFAREAATFPLIEALFKTGKTVSLPRCIPGNDLAAGVVSDLDQLVPGCFGILEPSATVPSIEPEALDLIVVPGLAFDRYGHRLGRGAGYYDRFLSRTPARTFKLGLAYDFQILHLIPTAGHDIPMDGLLTPSLYLEFKNVVNSVEFLIPNHSGGSPSGDR